MLDVSQADPYGVYQVEIREVEKVEINLGEGISTGYIIIGNRLRSLPIGSTLDSENSKFYWMPGPGFIGEYELVFIKSEIPGVQKKISVKVTIKPKFDREKDGFFKNSNAKSKF